MAESETNNFFYLNSFLEYRLKAVIAGCDVVREFMKSSRSLGQSRIYCPETAANPK
jgi:hypothetical protein